MMLIQFALSSVYLLRPGFEQVQSTDGLGSFPREIPFHNIIANPDHGIA